MTESALQISKPGRLTLSERTAHELNFPLAYLQLVKDTFARGASETELSLFLQTARRSGLDITARQIFMVKRWDSSLKKEVMSIQTSIDGFRLIADRSDKYAPGKQSIFTYKSDGSLESATAYVKKLVAGEWHEIATTAFYDEYVQKTREGMANSMWTKMPRLMLAKCAESLALRKAFPAELSGLYTSEEMGVETEIEKHGTSVPGQSEWTDENSDKAYPHIETGHEIPIAATPTKNGISKRVAGLADKLVANYGLELEDLVVHFLPEGVANFGDIDDSQAEGILPGLTELLNAKIKESKK
jgi:phage recombination protein Bet